MKRKAVAGGRTSSPKVSDAEPDATQTKKRIQSSKERNMPSNGAKAATAKRKPGRGTKKNPWVDEDFVMTSDKSPLIDIDLVKLLAKPEAWTCLDENEKKEVLALLPESIHPVVEPSTENPDGIIPPLPEEFVRYSNVWRDAIRQFQVDLQHGKYDPKWLSQAHKAMNERAEGKFDARKERDFEAFWGQKQRYHTNVPAGDSATIDFKTLVMNGVFEVGDIWRYSRSQGKGAEKFLVEKEVAVISVDGETLTFAIPPGRRVILPSMTEDQLLALCTKPEPEPTIESEPKSEPRVSSVTEIAQPVSIGSQIYDGENISITQAYIEENNQCVGTAQFKAEPNQITASEDCMDNKPADQTSMPDIKSLPNAEPPVDIMALEATPPDIETETTEVPNVIGQELPIKNLIFEELDDGCSTVSDPPDVIEEIDDADFHRSLQELGPAPPKDVPTLSFDIITYFSNTRKATPSIEPGVTTIQELEAKPSNTTIATELEKPDSCVRNDKSTNLRVMTDTTEPEPQAAEASNLINTQEPTDEAPIQLEATKVDATTQPTVTPINTQAAEIQPMVSDQSNTCISDTIQMPPEETPGELDGKSTCPPNEETNVSPSSNGDKPVIFPSVTGPMFLVRKIHELDGRGSNTRLANAWMAFRCIRNNQDMGTLWDVRHSWYVRSKR
ncbi:hypothetical protein MferCBS31731_001598 [Microsporum ferrugineum]